jgi:hypothetical protein
LGIERWDEKRGKWVLYTDQEEHSTDCAENPFESIPRRIFLDTNVLNLMVEFGEQIFEQAPLSDGMEPVRAEDVEALKHIFYVGTRANWDIVVSKKTLDEIALTRDTNLRSSLNSFAVEIFDETSEDNSHAASLGRRMIDAPFLAALPDKSDRELIGNAIGLRCDVFCTRDRRTIIKWRHRVYGLPIRLLTPREWWRHIKPWAGLWM